MKPKKNKLHQKGDLSHLDLETIHTGSSMDATGLIPAAPRSKEELEAYMELTSNNMDAAP